jgi:hypothetical protein
VHAIAAGPELSVARIAGERINAQQVDLGGCWAPTLRLLCLPERQRTGVGSNRCASWRIATESLPRLVSWRAEACSKNDQQAACALVVRFYEWACQRGYIASLPFSYRQIRAHGKHGMLAHVKTGGATAERASVLLREYRSPIKFLTNHQVQVCRQHLHNPSHRLLFELMLRSGLRSCEARTFPAKYVFDPSGRKDLVAGQVIRVDLSPQDLWIKFERPRAVDVPWRLMEDLNAYKNLERELRKNRGGGES